VKFGQQTMVNRVQIVGGGRGGKIRWGRGRVVSVTHIDGIVRVFSISEQVFLGFRVSWLIVVCRSTRDDFAVQVVGNLEVEIQF
jgi:hypothetical protein